MDAVDRPVVKAGHAQRATVAHASTEDFPRVAEIVAVAPRDDRHVAKVFGLGLAEAERHSGFQLFLPAPLDAMGRHHFGSRQFFNTRLHQRQGLLAAARQHRRGYSS